MTRPVSLFRSIVFAAGLLAGSNLAMAQQQQQITAEQLADIQKALTTPVLPAHLAIATDVLKASGLTTMFDNAMPNVAGALRVNVTRQRPELAKDIEEALKLVEAETTKVANDGVTGAARFMAFRMSEAELKEVHVFLTSPTGKKYVTALPQFMDQVVPYLEIWNQEASGRLMKVFSDEMAKRGHKL